MPWTPGPWGVGVFDTINMHPYQWYIATSDEESRDEVSGLALTDGIFKKEDALVMALANEMAEAILEYDDVIYNALQEAGVSANKYVVALHELAKRLRSIGAENE